MMMIHPLLLLLTLLPPSTPYLPPLPRPFALKKEANVVVVNMIDEQRREGEAFKCGAGAVQTLAFLGFGVR